MSNYVLSFNDTDKTKLPLVGGKGLNLGELAAIDGVHVPDGFCVTTDAYKKIAAQIPTLDAKIAELSLYKTEDIEQIRNTSKDIRQAIETVDIPADIVAAVQNQLKAIGEDTPFAIRSSATAEDLPTASFAGQHDSYLNIFGQKSILEHIRKCWASLFTDRAVIYRKQNGFEHKKVHLSVVVQKMIFPEAAGILFTADPISSNRKTVSIDAGFGLGEAMVSGTVNSDNYTVHDGIITDKKVSQKKLAVYALPQGGTQEENIEEARQNMQVLTDEQILGLERIGRNIEANFGSPQDIEWCLAKGKISIVQTRPITTPFPLPKRQCNKGRVYMSFGHQQMMTDALKPLGLSCLSYSGGGNESLMVSAGGRLFMDLSHDMAPPFWRSITVAAMGKVDPLIDSGLRKLAKRKTFMKSLARGKRFLSMGSGYFSWDLIRQFIKIYRANDANTVPALIKKNEAIIKSAEEKFATLSGEKLFTAADIELKELIKIIGSPQGMGSVWTGTFAMNWVNKKAKKWLGEDGAGDVLAQSVPNSIAGEMGLGLLDVSDVVRQYPAVMEYFKTAEPKGATAFFNDISSLDGGEAVSLAMHEYLAKHGVRCPGEIDITRPRWLEEPSMLAPLILSNIENFLPGAHAEIFAQGLKEAEEKQQDILNRLRATRGGKRKAGKMEKMIHRLRNFIGYREYPKYVMVWHYWIIKQALLREADKLVEVGIFRQKEDMFYLSFEELRETAHTKQFDYQTILERKEEYELHTKLTLPRLMTSEGEIISGEYKSGKAPDGALLGIAAASGTVEGRARVILRMEDANFAKGDILVTSFTDPSWTPAFVSINGLVAEVGGVMTHGSVVAREYGIPAVVGVENATKKIKDGQWIRINGTEGYVEILPD